MLVCEYFWCEVCDDCFIDCFGFEYVVVVDFVVCLCV